MQPFYEIINQKCASKGTFAVSKLPFADHCTLYFQQEQPTELDSISALNGKQGFVFAPFSVSQEHPLLLMEESEKQRFALSDMLDVVSPGLAFSTAVRHSLPENREAYARVFKTFHDAIAAGQYQKLVLARVSEEKIGERNMAVVYLKACQLYPRQHVILYSSRCSGTWLMATPEILLAHGPDGLWRTMALAGTMKVENGAVPEWSEKNKSEQQLVADYIYRCLKDYASDIDMSAQYTTFAADLAHLRTDFKFRLRPDKGVGDLLSALHPTPAVCGMPKKAAEVFIKKQEGIERKYYSGFAGTLNMDGGTNLYVSLRCMQLAQSTCSLYAGGGLLAESQEENEWQETEAKLYTMRQLLR